MGKNQDPGSGSGINIPDLQHWARDLAIRANIFSTGWIDLAATVGMREMEDGAGILNEPDEDEPNAASYRFPVVVGEDKKPRQRIWISLIRTLK